MFNIRYFLKYSNPSLWWQNTSNTGHLIHLSLHFYFDISNDKKITRHYQLKNIKERLGTEQGSYNNSQCSFCISPKNIRKPLNFLMFSGGIKLEHLKDMCW